MSAPSLRDAIADEREHNRRLRECDLESWYARLEAFTFRTVFVPLEQSEARALMLAFQAFSTGEQVNSDVEEQLSRPK